MDTVGLYQIYKDYAWREYDLLESRQNWFYIVNSIFLVAVGLVVQEQMHLFVDSPTAMKISTDSYFSTLLLYSKFALVIIPAAAIFFNIALLASTLSTLHTLDGIRRKWRDIKHDPKRHAGELPYVVAGFRDLGPKTVGWGATALPAIMLVLFWALVEILGMWLVVQGAHYSFPVI